MWRTVRAGGTERSWAVTGVRIPDSGPTTAAAARTTSSTSWRAPWRRGDPIAARCGTIWRRSVAPAPRSRASPGPFRSTTAATWRASRWWWAWCAAAAWCRRRPSDPLGHRDAARPDTDGPRHSPVGPARRVARRRAGAVADGPDGERRAGQPPHVERGRWRSRDRRVRREPRSGAGPHRSLAPGAARLPEFG